MANQKWQAFVGYGTSIAFPVVRSRFPFAPSAVTVTNRSLATIQVSDQQNGVAIVVGPYTIVTYPWTGSPSLYVQEAPSSSAPIAGDFLVIDFLAGEAAAAAVANGQVIPLPPTGWGPNGPGNSLANVNSGDPFEYGQVQQIINLLTGVMTGQAVNIANSLTTNGETVNGGVVVNGDLQQGAGHSANLDATTTTTLEATGAAKLDTGVTLGGSDSKDSNGNTLTNLVLLPPGTGDNLNGTGDQSGFYTPTGLPATATGIALLIEFSANTPATQFSLKAPGGNPWIAILATGTSAIAFIAGLGPVRPGAANQLVWTVGGSGGQAWDATIVPTAYILPA